MPELLGTLLILALVAVVVFFAVRSLWRQHKAGGCCGNCAQCGGCSGKSACCENTAKPAKP